MIDSKNGIIGLAIGDAMGVPIEFYSREELMASPIKEMKGYGSHNVPKGSWSDDTSMTLATVDAISETDRVIAKDIANNFLEWFRNAKYTPIDKVFDIGRSTLQAIAKFELKVSDAENCGGEGELDNGNGSLMRISPLIYYCYANNMNNDKILETVKIISSITHRHEISIMGCYIYVLFGLELLKSNNLYKAYKNLKNIDYSSFSEDCISKYKRILENDISRYALDDIKSTGYVVDTLEATFWVLMNTKSYNEAIIRAINLGNDTDTVGACVGALAGIIYGLDEINDDWKKDLIKYNYIEELCEKFNYILNNNK